MNPPTPERKKCPTCEGHGAYDRLGPGGHGDVDSSCCPTCKGTGLAPEIEPELPAGKSYCACDIFITDSRRPTHCHYCGQRKPPKKDSVKSQAFVKAMTAHIKAGGKFEPAPEPVSEKTYLLSNEALANKYINEIVGRGNEVISFVYARERLTEMFEAIASHMRDTVYRDEVKPLVEVANNLAVQLKAALKALPNPDHDEPRFTGLKWLHASERTEIEQALDKYAKALAAYQTTQKGEK